MAYIGTPLAGITPVITGPAGYVIGIDMSELDVNYVYQIQLSDDPGSNMTLTQPVCNVPSPPFVFPVNPNLPGLIVTGFPFGGASDNTLASLCVSNPNGTQLAYSMNGDTLYVFIQGGGAFPDELGLAIWYFRNPTYVSSGGDFCDMPPDAKNLVKYITLKTMYDNLMQNVPYAITNGMNTEIGRLRITPDLLLPQQRLNAFTQVP